MELLLEGNVCNDTLQKECFPCQGAWDEMSLSRKAFGQGTQYSGGSGMKLEKCITCSADNRVGI
jgi:hypothetical protein